MRKKIVMFFNKEKQAPNPFKGFGLKERPYYDFFETGCQAELDMYIASRDSGYGGGLFFKNPLYFDGKKFVKIKGSILADAVYDRSGGLKFPSRGISKKTLNCFSFKALCYDKNKMYRELGAFMPQSFKIKTKLAFNRCLKKFPTEELIVVKPAKGLGGKGIIVDTVSNILAMDFSLKEEMVVQKFVDTSFGIKGVVEGRHDLRIVIIGGKIIFAHARAPKTGSYLANVAQGGSIKEVPLQKISKKILTAVKKIQLILDKKYSFPIYSIDFGIEKERPFVFELNDQIGFPSEKMKSYHRFNEALIQRLGEMATN